MSDWYYGTPDNTQGPVPSDELRRLLASGQITPETQVWCPAEGVSSIPLKESAGGAPEAKATALWHYERSGTRVGPVEETELLRLLTAGELTRDTLVWSPSVGATFVRLGDTAIAPASTEPPPLPAAAVGNALAWLLVAVPLGSAILEQMVGGQDTSAAGWAVGVFVANVAISAVDQRRVIRSGVADRTISLGFWVWLVPVYLYQRARALKGPKYYFWAWLASFVASLFVGVGDVSALLSSDTYWGTGVPACDSRYEIQQVRKLFDGMAAVKAAGVSSIALENARELGSSGNIRTCSGQISATNAQTYTVIYTVEERDDQVLTNIQIR